MASLLGQDAGSTPQPLGGGGCFSPVSCYNPERDAFLLLDTRPAAACCATPRPTEAQPPGARWASASALFGACASADEASGRPRGVVELTAAAPPPPYAYPRVVAPPPCVAARAGRRPVFRLPSRDHEVHSRLQCNAICIA